MENTEKNSVGIETTEENFDAFAVDQPTIEKNSKNEQEETDDILTLENQKLSAEEDASVKAYRKLQSEKDKAIAEAEKLRKELESVRDYLPIARYFQENPEALEAVGRNMFAPEQKQEVPKEQPVTLEKPQKPVKPANYSRYEALNDPDSESAKYDEMLLEYNEKLADYLEKVNQSKLQEIEQYKEKLQRTEIERQQLEAINLMKQDLVGKYGFTRQQAEEFINYMGQYQPSLEDMVTLYKSKNTQKVSEDELRAKAERARRRMGNPPPAGMEGISNENYTPLPKGYKEPPSDDFLFGT